MDKKTSLILLAMILTVVSLAFAAPVGGQVTAGSSSRGSESSSQTVDITGGNVTSVAVSGNALTSRWAGFYGTVSGSLTLTDASAHKFYEWTVSDMNGAVVYAANDTISDWSSLSAASVSNLPSYLQTSATDNATNTMNFTGTTFTSSSITVNNAPYVQTYNSTEAGVFNTYALYSSTDSAYIMAGKVIDDGNGFDGSTLDYQLLVPANGSTTQYNFYLELP